MSGSEFSYRIARDGTVFITWEGRVIKTLRGANALRFVERMDGANAAAAQLLMAKATGHFKHGNERR